MTILFNTQIMMRNLRLLLESREKELDIFTYKLLKDNFKDIFQNNRLLHKHFLKLMVMMKK